MRDLPESVDVAVVGAGPAGLAVASGLDRRSVLVLESGDPSSPALGAELIAGDNLGDSYQGAGGGRSRGVGGTANLWNTPVALGRLGAKFLPLDPSDLEQWTRLGLPLGSNDLAPSYARAQTFCGLGPYNYDAGSWPPRSPTITMPHFAAGIYQLGTAEVFTSSVPAMLSGERACIAAGVTATSFEWSGRTVTAIRFATGDGRAGSIRVGAVVLAAGGIENPRLLLTFLEGHASPWLGRGLMEHPRDFSMTLEVAPGALERLRFFDRWKALDGAFVIGRLGLTRSGRAEIAGLNASISLVPRPAPSIRHRLMRLVRRSPDVWVGGYGWSEHQDALDRVGPIEVVLNLEQRPHPDNKVLLSRARDRFGMPLPAVDWRWRTEEQALLDRLRVIVATELEAAGLGRVRYRMGARPDPNAFHPAGTTRMSTDPALGVVDPDGRVHDCDNLFVAGSSVFPTAGFANPTLTVAALGFRLADHLTRI